MDKRVVPPAAPDRVLATDSAINLLKILSAEHGPLLLHQSGGCCDGSSAMCYSQGEYTVGDFDVLLGEICRTPFYMSRDQFTRWRHTQLILDVVPGRGGMFSLENGREVRFHIRSRLFDENELSLLAD